MTAVNLNRAVRGPVTAVPVVAGKGVRIVPDTVNNRFVVEADETVLWEGTPSSSSYTISLSEVKTNFERIGIYLKAWERIFFIELAGNSAFHIGALFAVDAGYLQAVGTRWNSSNDKDFTWQCTITTYWNQSLTSAWSNDIVPIKIVGINRISST